VQLIAMGIKNGQKKYLLQLFISVNEHTFEGDIVTSCAHEEIPLDIARKQYMVD
jgi:hypothetical protein